MVVTVIYADISSAISYASHWYRIVRSVFECLAAILYTLSIVCIPLDKSGSHAEDEYFNFGKTTLK